MNRVAVAIGSNVGDRAAHVRYAVERLDEFLLNLSVSSNYETDPVGVSEPQGRFLNAAAAGDTALGAGAVMDALLRIERDRGRERPFPLAPRTLDLDLILFGDRIIDTPRLTVPHPRFRERAFVLEPLAEIAPEMKDPVSGQTVRELLARLRKPQL